MYVTNENIRQARKANLYRFLIECHGEEITVFKNQNLQYDGSDCPCWIGKNHSGFVRYEGAERKTGNALDFCMDELSMSLPEAVQALMPYVETEV